MSSGWSKIVVSVQRVTFVVPQKHPNSFKWLRESTRWKFNILARKKPNSGIKSKTSNRYHAGPETRDPWLDFTDQQGFLDSSNLHLTPKLWKFSFIVHRQFFAWKKDVRNESWVSITSFMRSYSTSRLLRMPLRIFIFAWGEE